MEGVIDIIDEATLIDDAKSLMKFRDSECLEKLIKSNLVIAYLMGQKNTLKYSIDVTKRNKEALLKTVEAVINNGR